MGRGVILCLYEGRLVNSVTKVSARQYNLCIIWFWYYVEAPWYHAFMNETFPAGKFDVDSMSNLTSWDQNFNVRCRYFNVFNWTLKKSCKIDVEILTLIQRQINIEISTVPAGLSLVCRQVQYTDIITMKSCIDLLHQCSEFQAPCTSLPQSFKKYIFFYLFMLEGQRGRLDQSCWGQGVIDGRREDSRVHDALTASDFVGHFKFVGSRCSQ